jgi:anti-sigma factor RsiW
MRRQISNHPTSGIAGTGTTMPLPNLVGTFKTKQSARSSSAANPARMAGAARSSRLKVPVPGPGELRALLTHDWVRGRTSSTGRRL